MDDKYGITELFTVLAIFVFFIVIGFIIGFIYTGIIDVKNFKKELNSVGIERIEHCHNVYSNWNEIVWIKEK